MISLRLALRSVQLLRMFVLDGRKGGGGEGSRIRGEWSSCGGKP